MLRNVRCYGPQHMGINDTAVRKCEYNKSEHDPPIHLARHYFIHTLAHMCVHVANTYINEVADCSNLPYIPEHTADKSSRAKHLLLILFI